MSDDDNNTSEAMNYTYRCLILTLVVPILYFHIEVNLSFEKQYGRICKLVVSYCDPATSFFGVCPRDTPVCVQQEICARWSL